MIRIYNTMTRTKEEFVPLAAPAVGMYVCGVTVYDHSHIGHARSAMVFDVIRRYLTFKGYRVTFVKNYTDVDDRIIKRANQGGVSAREFAERFIAAERADMAALGVLAPDLDPKATEHVPQMIELIGRLVASGHAYPIDGDVYFEIRRFPPYGRLSGKNLDELLAGARVEVDERKRDPRDFALWKGAKPGEPAWDSPWGPGRPGWHIECSAMAMKYLGESFDFHGGGEDLIFPHHECEIAQAEACTIKRHDPDALRLWMLGTHYRNMIEWSEERVEEAARALDRFARLLRDATAVRRAATAAALPPAFAEFRPRFERAMDDDFNTPQALAALFDLVRALADARDRGPTATPPSAFVAGVDELVQLARVLGLFGRGAAAEGPPAEVERLVAARVEARTRRDFKRSDELRDEIARLGWLVEDTPAGPRLTPKGP
ncbi:MAG: cysteine--tRNA ligase [Candidatus Rokuibacteriota bacterium]|nr:MAG: cysteine--tRNA ligase [Candidatus Rokubacteria bacterium]